MRPCFIVVILVVIASLLAACSGNRERHKPEPPPEVSFPLSFESPEEPTPEPEEPEEESQEEEEDEDFTDKPAATAHYPDLTGELFYNDDPTDATSIEAHGSNGRLHLPADIAAAFYEEIPFVGFTPITTDYDMEIFPEEYTPCILFLHPDFDYLLRLDRELGVAVLEVDESKRYYYSFSTRLYDDINAIIQRYYADYASSIQPAQSP